MGRKGGGVRGGEGEKGRGEKGREGERREGRERNGKGSPPQNSCQVYAPDCRSSKTETHLQ